MSRHKTLPRTICPPSKIDDDGRMRSYIFCNNCMYTMYIHTVYIDIIQVSVCILHLNKFKNMGVSQN